MAEYRRYAGPAALLLAVTIAVVLIRIFAEHHSKPGLMYSVSQQALTTAHPNIYIVGAGDTLPKIAKLYGIPLATIRRLNPHVSPTNLYIGEKIRLR